MKADRRLPLFAVVTGLLMSLVSACGSGSHHSASQAHAPTTCPLTGAGPAGGSVPDRPALAVKVDNIAAARPQYGLGGADVVYEEPVEGGLTRFIVIYQCHDAARIQPIRSARIIDPDIIRQFGAHPLFAHAGGIQPALAAVAASPLIDVGTDHAPASTYQRDPNRAAPQNLFSSTAQLYAAGRDQHAPATAPPPVFSYGALPSGSTPATSVHIPYSYSDVTWTWGTNSRSWTRSYANSGTATQAEGGPITAANVIVMKVVLYASPYVEDATGAHENLLVLTGSGPAQILRDGAEMSGTWNRPSLTDNTRYLDASGHVIALSPGTTWVELVPTTIAVTVNP